MALGEGGHTHHERQQTPNPYRLVNEVTQIGQQGKEAKYQRRITQ